MAEYFKEMVEMYNKAEIYVAIGEEQATVCVRCTSAELVLPLAIVRALAAGFVAALVCCLLTTESTFHRPSYSSVMAKCQKTERRICDISCEAGKAHKLFVSDRDWCYASSHCTG